MLCGCGGSSRGATTMKSKRILLAGAALVSAAVICSSSKADIVYNVNLAVAPGSVMGSITTDGNTGVLNSFDIIDYSLPL
jgi:hypothetical protein